MTTAHTCPVCSGVGQVARPPHIPGDVQSWTDSGAKVYTCRTCGGKGIAWAASPSPTLPPRQPLKISGWGCDECQRLGMSCPAHEAEHAALSDEIDRRAWLDESVAASTPPEPTPTIVGENILDLYDSDLPAAPESCPKCAGRSWILNGTVSGWACQSCNRPASRSVAAMLSADLAAAPSTGHEKKSRAFSEELMERDMADQERRAEAEDVALLNRSLTFTAHGLPLTMTGRQWLRALSVPGPTPSAEPDYDSEDLCECGQHAYHFVHGGHPHDTDRAQAIGLTPHPYIAASAPRTEPPHVQPMIVHGENPTVTSMPWIDEANGFHAAPRSPSTGPTPSEEPEPITNDFPNGGGFTDEQAAALGQALQNDPVRTAAALRASQQEVERIKAAIREYWTTRDSFASQTFGSAAYSDVCAAEARLRALTETETPT